MHQYLEIHPEVKNALQKANRCCFGVNDHFTWHAYPQNINTAIEVEDIVRNNGAVPATIAIFNGKCYAGLTKNNWNILLQQKMYGK
jgi:pseudouridine-5'-phosphate glycosidase